jgi:phage terminase large subunit-like protein
MKNTNILKMWAFLTLILYINRQRLKKVVGLFNLENTPPRAYFLIYKKDNKVVELFNLENTPPRAYFLIYKKVIKQLWGQDKNQW